MAERASQAETTDLRTRTGEWIYDLVPLAGELWAIAGPEGLDPTTVDTDDLPAGYRWLEDDEWELACARKTRKLTATTPVGTFTRRTARTYSHVIVRHEGITLEQAIARKHRRIARYTSYLEKAIAFVEENGVEVAAQHGVHIDTSQKELDTALAVEPIATEGYHAVSWVGRPDLLAARLKGIPDGVAYPVDA